MKKRILVWVVVIALAVVFIAGCRRSPWNDGEFRGAGQGYGGVISVNLTIRRGKINAIVVTGHSETPGVSDQALSQIPQRIIQKQSTQVDVVSGATRTSQGIIDAVNNALEKARKQ